jgi:hypothetical protein
LAASLPLSAKSPLCGLLCFLGALLPRPAPSIRQVDRKIGVNTEQKYFIGISMMKYFY